LKHNVVKPSTCFSAPNPSWAFVRNVSSNCLQRLHTIANKPEGGYDNFYAQYELSLSMTVDHG
jgi:hypothetical protein